MRVPAEYVYDSLDMYYQGARINEISTHLTRKYKCAPSKDVIQQWVNKFTDRTIGYFNKYDPPSTGNKWIISEYIRKLAGIHIKTYDIVDTETRYLLATQVSTIRSRNMIKTLMEQAVKKAGKNPKIVLAFINYSYFEKIKKLFKCQARFISLQSQEFEYDIELIEFIIDICEYRYKIIGKNKKMDTVNRFIGGWNSYYNYFHSQPELDNRTPAEVAGIDYQIKNWRDLIVHESN